MLEVSKDGDHGIELSLELSIGGCYKELEDNAAKQAEEEDDVVAESEKIHNNVSHVSDAFVGCAKDESGSEAMDHQQRKRGFHALRRQEARRKKAEKHKRLMLSKGINGNDKALLEAQQFQVRLHDREKRENEKKMEDFLGKNYDAMMSTTQQVQHGTHINGFGYPCGVQFWGQSVGKDKDDDRNVNNLFQPVATRSFRPFHPNGNGNGSSDPSHASSVGFDSARNCVNTGQGNQRVVANGSLERTSSAFSDYQTTSQRGGSCSTDTGSHSNYSQGCQQQLSASATSNTLERSEINGSSSHMDFETHPNGKTANFNVKPGSSSVPICERTSFQKSDPVDNPTSVPQGPTSASSKVNNEVVNKPPKPQSHDQGITTALPRMPLVSTTGNGPNGKTVNGFLYRYTKTEVSIVCVCHGSSFSPAEFVEHAGWIDVSHPLRHITIVPNFG